jgi:phosphatidylglycerol---prolipoprotein diacylglyceryl transferase
MGTLAAVIWDVNPEIFQIGPLSIRWYGLCWVFAFASSIYITKKLFKKDGVNPDLVDTAFMYVFIGTVVGARLGHVFFYGWSYYSQNLLDIFKIWEGGLASHGAAVGIIISIWLFSKYSLKKPFIWMIDRVVIPVAISGAFIRFGNLMNHEIYGQPTDLSWGFVFSLIGDGIPRHPSQLYESLMCIVILAILLHMFYKTEAKNKPGLIFGTFMVLLFIFRFFVEFLKENQEAFENEMALNMGQILSIPFVLVGLVLMIRPIFAKKP